MRLVFLLIPVRAGSAGGRRHKVTSFRSFAGSPAGVFMSALQPAPLSKRDSLEPVQMSGAASESMFPPASATNDATFAFNGGPSTLGAALAPQGLAGTAAIAAVMPYLK